MPFSTPTLNFSSLLPSLPSLLRGSLTLRPPRLCGSLKKTIQGRTNRPHKNQVTPKTITKPKTAPKTIKA
jgi:hypothetical protein